MNRSRAAITLAFALSAIAAPTAHAASSLTAGTGGTYPFGKDRAVVAGSVWRVVGTAKGVSGGNVIVRLYRSGKVVKAVRPKVRANGRYATSLRLGKTGPVTVEVVRAASAGVAASRASKFSVFVIDPGNRSGPSMRFFQRRLAAMGYWPTLSGRYDYRTRWAVMAYRKVNGMPRNFSLNRAIFLRVARGVGRFVPKYGATGRNRVEADLSRQIYVLITAKGKVYKVVPTSTGKPSTPSDIGRFRFYRKQPGVNGVGMVNSSYYNGGEALHGYPDVPPYPASGGCLRTPTTYSFAIMKWVRLGDRIDVYR
jgi:L,D-transpeptidase catalytic domain